MTQSLQLLSISGSLRTASSNTSVLQALSAIAPANVRITLYAQMADLPHFNPDLESEDATLPTAVRALRTQIGNADGLLISSPEYAHGVPGSLKNLLDWLVGSLEFPYKPVALINISPRSTYAQASLTEILTTMSAQLISDPALTIALPHSRLTRTEMLGDPSIQDALQRAIETVLQAIEESKCKHET